MPIRPHRSSRGDSNVSKCRRVAKTRLESERCRCSATAQDGCHLLGFGVEEQAERVATDACATKALEAAS